MNEQTTQLIEQLAQKLGTTSEYLWNILLRQAPINAMIDLIMFAIVLLALFLLWKVHKKLYSKIEAGSSRTYYDEHEAAVIVPMILGLIIITICLIGCLLSINDIIIGFFSPEYWALKHILNSLTPNCP